MAGSLGRVNWAESIQVPHFGHGPLTALAAGWSMSAVPQVEQRKLRAAALWVVSVVSSTGRRLFHDLLPSKAKGLD